MATNLRVTNQAVEVLGEGGGSLRVTAQAVEVIGIESGTLRVTNQLVEVLASVDSFSALNALSLTQTATATVSRTLSASNVLTLADEAIGDGVSGTSFIDVSVSDTLEMIDDVSHTIPIHAIASDEITLADEATYVREINLRVTDDLGLNDSIEYHGPICVEVTQKIFLSDEEVDHIPDRHLNVEDILVLSDNAGRYIPITVADTLDMTGRAGRHILASAADALVFTQLTGHDEGPGAASRITFTDIARYSVDYAIDPDDIGGVQGDVMLTDSATFVLVPALRGITSNGLALTDAVTMTADFLRPASDTLELVDAVAFTIDSPDVTNYRPFIGSSSDPKAPAPPPATLAYAAQGQGFKLFHPFVAPTQTLTLRAPDLGNKDRLSFTRISRETRGGTLKVFADPMWPKTQTLALTFSGLRKTEIQSLLGFMEDYLGQEIGIYDWENRAWRGVITQPDEAAVQNGKDNYSISFEFEGELNL
jgi:hypothetical protein